MRGICDAIGVFKWGLMGFFGCVKGDAASDKVYRGGECGAIALI